MQILVPLTVLSCILYLAFQNRSKSFPLFVIAVLFAVVAFSFQPLQTDDLAREYEKLRDIADQGWKYFSVYTQNIKGGNYTNSFGGLYFAQIYYYIFAQFEVLNWFPAITIFIDYFLEFRLLKKIMKKYELSELDGFVLFLMIICFRETYNMMSGIRNYLAFTIFGYALYVDLVERKSKIRCFIVYVLTALMHPSAWMIVAVRGLCYIPSRKIKNMAAIFVLFWGNLLNVVLRILADYSGLSFINALYVKLYSYTNENSVYSSLATADSRYMIYMLSNLFIVILVVYIFIDWAKLRAVLGNVIIAPFKRLNLKEGTIYVRPMPKEVFSSNESLVAYENVFYFSIICLSLMIGALPHRIIFSRIGIMVRIISIIPTAILFSYCNQEEMHSRKKTLVFIVLLACLWKFVIMMWFCNRSMHFDLFGIYY